MSPLPRIREKQSVCFPWILLSLHSKHSPLSLPLPQVCVAAYPPQTEDTLWAYFLPWVTTSRDTCPRGTFLFPPAPSLVLFNLTTQCSYLYPSAMQNGNCEPCVIRELSKYNHSKSACVIGKRTYTSSES